MLLQKGCVGKSGLICRNPPIERWYHKIVANWGEGESTSNTTRSSSSSSAV